MADPMEDDGEFEVTELAEGTCGYAMPDTLALTD